MIARMFLAPLVGSAWGIFVSWVGVAKNHPDVAGALLLLTIGVVIAAFDRVSRI